MSEITEAGETQVSAKRQAGKSAAKKQTKSRSAVKPRNNGETADVVPMRSLAQYPRYASLEERQKAVERSKRAVYAHLNKMTNAHINLAAKGNCQSAKFLFEFAGIDDLATAPASKGSQPNGSSAKLASDDDPTKAVASFCAKLGVAPVKLKPPKPVEAGSDPLTAES